MTSALILGGKVHFLGDYKNHRIVMINEILKLKNDFSCKESFAQLFFIKYQGRLTNKYKFLIKRYQTMFTGCHF